MGALTSLLPDAISSVGLMHGPVLNEPMTLFKPNAFATVCWGEKDGWQLTSGIMKLSSFKKIIIMFQFYNFFTRA